RRRLVEAELRLADRDEIAVTKRTPLDAHRVDEDAVLAAEILDHDLIAHAHDPRVLTADEMRRYADVAVRAASDQQRARADAVLARRIAGQAQEGGGCDVQGLRRGGSVLRPLHTQRLRRRLLRLRPRGEGTALRC